MNIYFLQIVLILFLSLLTLYVVKKINLFEKISKDLHQNFVNKSFVLPIGGYLLFISILVLNFYNSYFEIICLFSIFLIGSLSDLKKFNSPKLRLIFQTLIILLFLYFSQIEISSTRIDFIDDVLKNTLFNIFFTTFCLLILINGTNFVDGLNGLVIGYYISIIFIISISGVNLEIFSNKLIFNQFIIILIVLLLLNYFNKLYLGDSGSYLLGFLFGTALIKIYALNQFISPFFIILLLWYPCFENLFSIIRKYRFRKSPIKPDNKHFHQLLFYFINKKLNPKNKIVTNNLSSILIVIYNFIVFYIGLIEITKTNHQITIIIFNLLIYIFLYIKLLKFRLDKIKQ
jgi:UDP-N-acetylmuramyl pentapeptide phosphotransferase/UDP-N-acetylglucosamine-1-phosphate transferase